MISDFEGWVDGACHQICFWRCFYYYGTCFPISLLYRIFAELSHMYGLAAVNIVAVVEWSKFHVTKLKINDILFFFFSLPC